MNSSSLFGTIKFWRGLVFSIINSAIISGAVAVLITYKCWYIIVFIYLMSFGLQNYLYSKMFSSYRKIEIKEEK